MIDDVFDFFNNITVVKFNFCFGEMNELVYRLVKWANVVFCNEVWFNFSFFLLDDVFVADFIYDLN